MLQWVRALAAAGVVLFITAADASAQADSAWVARAQALAERIHAENLILTDRVREQRRRDAQRLAGRERLQILYDAAADDYIGSSAERAAVSMPAFEREVAAQNDARYRAMANMLRAYAPALDGDYVGARRNLEAALASERDPFARGAGERLRAYALADLGLVGNALEAARQGLTGLPLSPDANTLRSGLQDAMSYTSMRIGDVETAFDHLQRSVDLDIAAGKPLDGLTVVYNIASMLADTDNMQAALHTVSLDDDLARRSGVPTDRFFASMLCAKVSTAARDYARALRCADTARAVEGAPAEYMTRVLTFRARALAGLGHAHAAREALEELRDIAATRGDPVLIERIAAIEPQVLRAEGRMSEAFAALQAVQESSERNVLRRFNAGVKELRATLENEVARADERAAAQAMRSELQTRTFTLAFLLGSACLAAAIIIAFLIYRSRRAMVVAVSRAEEVLARRDGGGTEPREASETAVAPTTRLANILDEIERRDVVLKQAFIELEAARTAAEGANLAKSQFLTTMSHELRTPLNAIIGYSEMLMENAEVSGAQDDHADLTRIRGAGHRLLLMINDLLDLAKIEAGRTVIEAGHVDVSGMLDDIVATVRPTAEGAGNTLIDEIERPLGAAYTDGFKLSQCLLNLMSNAVKFTKGGDVTLRARRETVDGADWLNFDVIDTGIGIAPEAQARLFQPFVQADPSITRKHGGTGLGLAITRRLAQMLGGDVTVKSELGRGATFTLRVPAKLAVSQVHREPALEEAA